MKKIISLFICLNFLLTPCYSLIDDDFVIETLGKNLKIKDYEYQTIVDEFVESTLDKNKKIKQYTYTPIRDSFAEINKGKNTPKKVVIFDDNNINSILIRIKKPYTTKSGPQEGDYLEFETVNDIVLKNNKYTKGTTVKGRIETISLNKSFGVPSDLIVGNFSIGELPLAGEINKTGANRTLWVYPLVYGGSLFFGAGVIFAFIRGGHAKIKPSQVYELYIGQ